MSNSISNEKLFSALKTLCILSYLMCAFWFIMCPMSIAMFSQMDQKMVDFMNTQNPGQGDIMQTIQPFIKPMFLGVLALNVLSLVGVVLMHKLKFYGLYIYIVGELGFVVLGSFFKIDGLQSNSNQVFGGLIQTLMMIGIDSIFIFQYRNILKAILKQ
jgi:hypothetical protein